MKNSKIFEKPRSFYEKVCSRRGIDGRPIRITLRAYRRKDLYYDALRVNPALQVTSLARQFPLIKSPDAARTHGARAYGRTGARARGRTGARAHGRTHKAETKKTKFL